MTYSSSTRLSIEQRQRLVSGASTVFERSLVANRDTATAEPFTPTDEAAAALRAWTQVFSPGDPDALERRLRWDGLDRSTVARAISMPGLPQEEPHWLSRVEQIVALARAVAAELPHGLPEGDLFGGDEPPPFLELLVPALRVSRRALEAAVELAATLSPAAVAALERQLLRDLAGLAALAMLEELRAAQRTDAERYAAFTERMLRDGLLGLFLRYPVLARQIALTTSRWVETTAELVTRLEADRAVIAHALGGGASHGRVRTLEPALSDAHEGGRRVIALHFDSGLRLVYKPRPVGIERAFGELVRWAASRGLDPPQRTAHVLDRHEYGWVELVDQERFRSVDEVRRYYRKSGGLICLAYVLRAKDLHMENVVATREGPVLIDLELMLQPVTPASASNRPTVGDPVEHAGGDRDNCLTSSLLTFVEEGSGQVFDVGGLRGTGRGVPSLARRAWRGLGSDAIECVDDWTFETRVSNQVVLEGRVERPEDYAEEICRGFDETYRFLLTHRDELLTPDGPLSCFAGCVSRVLSRSTNQYALLRYVLVRPRYLSDGVRWSTALDALNRTFSRSRDRPAAWPLLVAERQALEALDIPRFTVRTDETRICAAGHPVLDGHFIECGLSVVTAQLRKLSTSDLHAQLDDLTRALRESVHTRFRTEPIVEPDAHEAEADAFFVAHARWIAEELLGRSTHTSRGRQWSLRPGISEPAPASHHLYEGSLGPAIFLAALATATGEERWRAAAHEVLAPLAAAIVDDDTGVWAGDAIGAASGLGSMVYGLSVVGGLLDDRSAFELATRVAHGLTDARIDADTALDVTSGAAGAILGLLALYRVTGERHLLARAVRCGDHLRRGRLSSDEGVTWPTADGRRFIGFAHGAAGIAYALDRLFEVTGDEGFRIAAAEGYRYVAARFLPGLANWPMADASTASPTAGSAALGAGPTTMTAWCHGAPGIALAIALGTPTVIDQRLGGQLDRALATTAAALPHRADHVCCGNLGRVDALLTAGHRLGRGDALEAAGRLARQVLERARRKGHFGLTADGFAYRIFDQGFFRGLSGIGYTMLHLAAPSRLPAILAFEPPIPGEGRDDGHRGRKT